MNSRSNPGSFEKSPQVAREAVRHLLSRAPKPSRGKTLRMGFSVNTVCENCFIYQLQREHWSETSVCSAVFPLCVHPSIKALLGLPFPAPFLSYVPHTARSPSSQPLSSLCACAGGSDVPCCGHLSQDLGLKMIITHVAKHFCVPRALLAIPTPPHKDPWREGLLHHHLHLKWWT